MNAITIRSLILEVPQSWYNQYYPWTHNPALEETYNQLRKLNLETCTAQDIADIIGNDSWTKPPNCNECGQGTDWVLQVGEPPDYESSTACLCRECLAKAAEYLKL